MTESKRSGVGWALCQAGRRFLAFAGAVLLAWLLLAPREQPARQVFVWGGQVSVQYQRVVLPVENKALARDVRRLINSLRYDDLQDVYPSLGQWPHRVAGLGQSQPVITFQAGRYTLELFQAEQRPQVILSRTDRQGQVIWKDFYCTDEIALLEKLLALESQIRQQGPDCLKG